MAAASPPPIAICVSLRIIIMINPLLASDSGVARRPWDAGDGWGSPTAESVNFAFASRYTALAARNDRYCESFDSSVYPAYLAGAQAFRHESSGWTTR